MIVDGDNIDLDSASVFGVDMATDGDCDKILDLMSIFRFPVLLSPSSELIPMFNVSNGTVLIVVRAIFYILC